MILSEWVPLAFGMPGGWEWVILAAVAILVFGGTRLAGVGKSAGKAIREFKEEVSSKPNENDATNEDEKDTSDS